MSTFFKPIFYVNGNRSDFIEENIKIKTINFMIGHPNILATEIRPDTDYVDKVWKILSSDMDQVLPIDQRTPTMEKRVQKWYKVITRGLD